MRSIIVAALIGAGVAQAAAEDDPYIWLEDRNGAQALEWAKAESERTREVITSDPRFADYYAKALALFQAEDIIPFGYIQGDYVYNYWQDAKNPLGVWRRATVASYKTPSPEWDVILDTDRLAAEEGIGWVFGYGDCLRPDYRICAISMSPDGGDASVVREFDLEKRQFMPDGFNLPVSKSAFSYIDADTAFLSAAFTDGEVTTSGYPRVVKRWKRGTPHESAPVIFEGQVDDLSVGGFVMIDERDESRTPFVQRSVDFYTSELFLLRPDDSTVQVPVPPQLIDWDIFDGQFVFIPAEDWTAKTGEVMRSGGLYAFDFDSWRDSGETGAYVTLIEPTERRSIETIASTKGRFFVSVLDNVQGEVLAFRHADRKWSEPVRIDLPANGTVSIADTDVQGSAVSFTFNDLITPSTLFWSEDDGESLAPIKAMPARFDSAKYVAEQFEATSKDGTRIPYFVARPKDQSGPVPTLLYAYGGFQSSMLPWYSGLRGQLWLEQGNAWVLANIRGGGEFGPAWHQAALKEKRQNAFDDFAAVAQDIAARGITTAAQLGIQGGSNGGLLVGVSLTQRPELFGAAISEVPLLDMMRYTQLPPGASWIAEYGDPAIPEEAAFIREYSPYQNVVAGKDYPKTLFMTSTADDRVHPGHARKMAAKMLAQGHDVLFHEYLEGGHGGSGDIRRQAEWYAMEYMFLQQSLEGAEGHAGMAMMANRAAPFAAAGAAQPEAGRCGVPDVAATANGPRAAGLEVREAAARQTCDLPPTP
ncbi:MAG: S9 family peptidase [Rhizobiaceae bacterium]|nr:S9 family peptidase [Rhizobiaceae bacterium]